LRVMKFGGTSVGSAQRFKEVANIVRKASADGEPPIVVLSAMSGVTDALIRSARLAEKRQLDQAISQSLTVVDKHEAAIAELFSDEASRTKVTKELDPYFSQINILLQGIAYLGELSKRSLDAISGFGELLSTVVFVHYLKELGQKSAWVDARQFMVTDENFGAASPIWSEVAAKAKVTFKPLLRDGVTAVTQGFIGTTTGGITTTFGRGGSDYTASILGVVLDAAEIQIWTDVDGMMTADPRLVPDATVLSEVSFQEASELAYFGAQVLHPLTIKPAVEKKIPVRILNTMRPESTGTLITENPKIETTFPYIRSIASKKGLTAIFINTPKMLMTYGFLAKVFDIFAHYETPIDLICTSEVSISLTTDKVDELDKIVKTLEERGDEVKVMHNVAIVSVVGQHFRVKCGIWAKILDALENINLIMISSGASDVMFSFVLSNEEADKAVKQLHEQLFSKVAASAH
jgi:aspartate kinase